jgi:threonine/homoserine/homoserine lactone efflux protein
VRPEPARDPRLAPKAPDLRLAKAGQRAALVLAGVGVFWVLATWAGDALGWSTRLRALFDLVTLAGFAFALYTTWQVWRLRRADRG